MGKQFLEIGKIISTHGIKGEVKVFPWCDDPSFLCEIEELFFDDEGKEQIEILSARVQKNIVVMKINGVSDMTQAEKYKGKILFVNRDEFILDENTYFIQDLIGLDVYDVDDNTYYGKIEQVTQAGSNDVYYIKKEDKTVLVPAIKDVVILTDIKNKIMKIKPLKGLF